MILPGGRLTSLLPSPQRQPDALPDRAQATEARQTEAIMGNTAAQTAQEQFVVEKSLARKIAESSLYDWKPTARFLLREIATLRMAEDSNYPDDAPEKNKADKKDWCWMSQFQLGLRIGADERTVRRWIAQFRKDGVILYRAWTDDNGTNHSEYKINEKVLDAFQRPSQKPGVQRPPRYSQKRKGNKGSFSTANQPGRTAQRRAIMEEDDE